MFNNKSKLFYQIGKYSDLKNFRLNNIISRNFTKDNILFRKYSNLKYIELIDYISRDFTKDNISYIIYAKVTYKTDELQTHLKPIPYVINAKVSYNINNEPKNYIMVIRYGNMYNEYKYVEQIVRNNLKKILLSCDNKMLESYEIKKEINDEIIKILRNDGIDLTNLQIEINDENLILLNENEINSLKK